MEDAPTSQALLGGENALEGGTEECITAWQAVRGVAAQANPVHVISQALLSMRDKLLVRGLPVEKAAVLVDQAVDGEPMLEDVLDDACSEAAIRAYLVHRKTRLIVRATLAVLVLLLFFEAPPWCERELPDGDKYPLGGLSYISHARAASIQLSCVLVLSMEAWLCYQFSARGSKSIQRLHVKKALVLCGLLLDSLLAFFPFSLYLAKLHIGYYLRIIAVVVFQREMRDTFRALIQMAKAWLDVAILLFLYVLVFAWLGMLFFHNTLEGEMYFPTYRKSLLNMFMLLTYAQTPDMQIPAYEANRSSVWFFVIFLVIGIFLLLNLVLAVIYEAYKERVVKTLLKERKIRDEDLRTAFHLLDQEGQGFLDSSRVFELFQALGKFRSMPPSETMQLYFDVLDSDHDFKVGLGEFLELCEVIILKFEKLGDCHFMERRWPSLFFSPKFQRFLHFVRSQSFYYLVDGMLFLNLVVVIMEGLAEMSSHPRAMVWRGAVNLFGLLYFVEISLRIVAWGPHLALRSFRSRLDFWITIAIGVILILSFSPYGPNNGSHWVRYLEVARILRLLHLLAYLHRFKIIVRTLMAVLPALAPLMGVLFCFLCLYAAVGVQLFGGLVYKGNPALNGTDYLRLGFTSRNFNDFSSGMVMIFDLLVAAYWNSYMDGFVALSGTKWAELYFISFYCLGVILMLNLVVAVVLSAFVTQMKVEADKEQERIKTVKSERESLPREERATSPLLSSPTRLRRRTSTSLKVLESMFKEELASFKAAEQEEISKSGPGPRLGMAL